MELALAAVFSIIFLAALLLEKILEGIPARELRRMARGSHDNKASVIYRLSSYGASSKLFLWIIAALSAAVLVLVAANIAEWIGFIAILAVVWLIWMVRPLEHSGGWLWYIASASARLLTPVVASLQPVLMRLASKKNAPPPKKLYETEDLVDFLKLQRRSSDNRISENDLSTAAKALVFSDKAISSVMTPRSKVKWALAKDSVGPMVMDELHKSGQSAFPVVREVIRSGNPEIIGTLYINDLLDNLDKGGRVRDIMQPKASYINETDNLMAAANTFLTTNTHLLVVINNFEEVAGVLTLEDLLKQIFGVAVAVTEQPDSQAPKPEVESEVNHQ